MSAYLVATALTVLFVVVSFLINPLLGILNGVFSAWWCWEMAKYLD